MSVRSFRSLFNRDFLDSYQAGTLSYTYKDVPCVKSPIDLAIYMKAIWDLKPRLILEIGSKHGGSALWFADLITLFGLDARVISIDLEPPTNISDDRIIFTQGDVNTLQPVFKQLNLAPVPHPWFVNEDSAHTYTGCRNALVCLSEWMRPGDLLVMEDGILDELGLSEEYDGGPNRAIAEFMIGEPDAFEIETDLCDMFGVNSTYCPNGYLRKK